MAAASAPMEEYGVSPVALDALERDFVEVMKELSAEDNLERFRLEYEKLHRSLKRSHESEKRLIKKCQELHQEIMANAAKVQSAIRLSQDDENTIATLRKEIEKTWKLVDSAHEKESRAKDTIQMLKKEVNRLNKLVDEGAGLTLGQETNLQELIQEKREYTKEVESIRAKVAAQNHQLKELADAVRKLETEALQKQQEETLRQSTYGQLKKEYETELRKRELQDAKVKDLHTAIEKRSREVEGLKEKHKEACEMHDKLAAFLKTEQGAVHELQVQKEKTVRDLHTGNATAEKISMQNDQIKKTDKPALEKTKKKTDAQLKAAQQKKLSLEEAVATQEKEIRQLEQERDKEAERTHEHEAEIKKLMEQIEKAKREVEREERKVKDKVRDKNLAITHAVRSETLRVEMEGEKAIESGKNRSLEQELDAHHAESQLLRKKAVELEKQKEKYKQNAIEATERYNQAVEEVSQGKHRLVGLQHQLEDEEKRLRNQNTMYEQVLSERNLYSKDHNTAKEEIAEMERKFRVMDQQIKQLKDELRKRESDLCEAHANRETVQDALKNAEERLTAVKASLDEAKQRGTTLAEEIKQLTQIIADCDTEKAKQQMKFNAVTNERNILATQLIRRNEELSLLYEKIRIQQSTLLKGEAQYHERLANIGVLRNKAHELRTKLRKSLARIRYVEEMKRQITTLQRQLIQERTKVKALFEELQNPMNVHRWRKLDGSNPVEYENIVKLRTLQRRLIAKTEESRQKDIVIQQKEQQYQQLKNVLARQPGPEIAEQLTVYHENIVKRAEQMKRMQEELSSNQTHVDEYKHEIQRLQDELQDVKRRFFDLKGKNTLMVREKQLQAQTARQPRMHGESEFVVHQQVNQPRFAGGGFCLSI